MTVDELYGYYQSLSSDVDGLRREVINASDTANDAKSLATEANSRSKANLVTISNQVIPTLDDHETRLHLLEDSKLQFTKIRNVKSPMIDYSQKAVRLFMPRDLTMDDFRKCNENIGQNQKFNWFTKIFNPNGYGRISFDLDRHDEGKIKSVVIGQNTRLMIPSGIKIHYAPNKSVMVVSNINEISSKKGYISTVQVAKNDKDEEVMICITNITPEPLVLNAGEELVQLIHTFVYPTIPELLNNDEFNQL